MRYDKLFKLSLQIFIYTTFQNPLFNIIMLINLFLLTLILIFKFNIKFNSKNIFDKIVHLI